MAAGLRPAGTRGAFAKLTSDPPFRMTSDVASKFEIYRFLDPRFNPNNPTNLKNKYIAVSGGPAMTRYVCTAAEYSDKHIRWNNIVPLGPEFLYDMHMLIHYRVRVRIIKLKSMSALEFGDGGAGGDKPWATTVLQTPKGTKVNVFNGNTFALRPFPLHQCTRSNLLRMNDKEIQGLPMESLNARIEYWPPDLVRLSSWSCPHMRPNAQDPMSCRKRSVDNPYAPLSYNVKGDFSNGVVPNCRTRYYTFDYEGKDTNYKPAVEGAPNTCAFEAVYDITEPILCEPLDYTSGKDFPRIMWNLTTFEVTYNLDDLANMFMIDKVGYWLNNCNQLRYEPGDVPEVDACWDTLVDRNNWTIEFVSAPELIYKVYTPIPGWEPRTSFFSPYREYTLFKSMAANNVVVTKDTLVNQLKNRDLLTYDMPEYEINSGDISLTYFPNSVFIYIKQSENERYGTFENRLVELDTCSKITGISVTYHNNTTIGQSLKADDIYEISLRNGLQERTPLDYNISEADYAAEGFHPDTPADNYSNGSYYCGAGLVARFYPGLDFHTGNMSGRMIGGCKTDCNLISFKVKFQPLNLFREKTTYQLFVLFEQEGGMVMDRRIAVVGIVGLKAVQEFDVDTTVDTNFYPMHMSGHNYGAGWQDYVKNALSWFKKHKVASKLIGAFAPEDKAAKWGKRASAIEDIMPDADDWGTKSGAGYRMRNGKVKRKRPKFYI